MLLKLPLFAALPASVWRAAMRMRRWCSRSSRRRTPTTHAPPGAFLADMRQATGLAVEGYYAPMYSAAIDALVATARSSRGCRARRRSDCIERANVEVFGQMVDCRGSPGYRSIIVTRRDGPIASIDQLMARPRAYGFAMGEVSSTSGMRCRRTRCSFRRRHPARGALRPFHPRQPRADARCGPARPGACRHLQTPRSCSG
jgi:hypothetical protein